jgi:uncharacterized protein (TIGR02145 family)
MKINRAKYFIIFAWILLSGLSGCKKEAVKVVPTVIITSVTDITTSSFTISGEVTFDGGSPVTTRGFCYSFAPNPTIADSITPSWGGLGTFFSLFTDINPGTTYYFRAYATNAVGTGYGNQVTVTTLAVLPSVGTEIVRAVSATSAISSSGVGGDGGAAVTARGVCWSTLHNPTISDHKTSDGTGVGSYTSNVNGLIPNTAYYLRAYATNSVGTSYGREISFATEQRFGPTVTDIDGNVYHTITIGTQVWMLENLRTTHFRNGDPIPTSTGDSGMPGPNEYKCYWDYNRDANNSAIYGRLYGRGAASDSRNIAPEGWHVPSVAEWTTLFDFLTNNGYGYQGSGNDIAKSLAAKSGWRLSSVEGDPGNDQASNNSSGFTALPGGSYLSGYSQHGSSWFWMFFYLGLQGQWWGKISDIDNMSSRGIDYDRNTIYYDDYQGVSFPVGLSVRCLKD